jgi:hypothetical protein
MQTASLEFPAGHSADMLVRTAGEAQRIVRDFANRWVGCCDEFLDWQRRHVLEVEPSAERLEAHRQALKFLLRATRLLHCQAADPDFPDRSLAAELSARLQQLEQSWEMIQDPMPAQAAEAVLKAVFADGR